MLGFVQGDSLENGEIKFNADGEDGLVFTQRTKSQYKIDLSAGLPSECLVCCNLAQYSSIASHQLPALNFVPLRKRLLSAGERDEIEVYRFAPVVYSRVKQHRLDLREIRIWMSDLQGNILNCLPEARPTVLSLAIGTPSSSMILWKISIQC